MTVPLVIVAAVARNGVLGANNRMLWRLKSDWRRMKAITMGKPLLMGRKTFQSIGAPLPGRETIVITRDPAFSYPGIQVAHGVGEGLALAESTAVRMGADEVIIFGGAQIYAATMGRASRLALTEVDLAPEGDAVFPSISPVEWRETRREAHQAGPDDEAPFAFVDYVRR
jgi:dihydrofolate reductase